MKLKKMDLVIGVYNHRGEQMKLLVLATDYPDLKGNISLMYIHTRNLIYTSKGIKVTVLNFSASRSYSINNINVISLEDFNRNQNEPFDLLICHAPNIRNHYFFLKKYKDNFKKIIFFFHGHEVLRVNKVYPKPFPYVKKKSKIKLLIQDSYDYIKLAIWKKYFNKIKEKSHFVFVSHWMLKEFLYWTRISPKTFIDKTSIIYNGVGKIFEENSYDINTKKEYDFITIRSYFDGSKYGIDIVNELAKNNLDKNFLVIGTGDYFKYNQQSPNITIINKTLNHEEIIMYLNKGRCALMPTRTDAQGLMMCEMATFGMPLITSDIPVCHEVCKEFPRVSLINNQKIKTNLSVILEEITKEDISNRKNKKYFTSNTSAAEISLFNKVLEI